MKRLLLIFSMVMAFISMATAQESVVYTCSFGPETSEGSNLVGDYTSTWTNTCGEHSWTLVNFNNNRWTNGWTYVKCGRKNVASVASISTDFASADAITKIVVTIGKITAANLSEMYLETSESANFENATKTDLTKPTAPGDVTITLPDPKSNLYYKLVFSCGAGSGNGIVQVNKIEYYAEQNPDLKPAGLAFAETEYNVDLGEAFNAPKIENPNNLAVTYSSSDENIASVDATTGDVTIKSFGTVKINATSEATEEYRAGNASYTINITATAKSLAEYLEYGKDLNASNKETAFSIKANFDATVTYANGSNIYVTDGSAFGLLYQKLDETYAEGDIIPAGWTAKITYYNGILEMTSIEGLAPASGKGTFTPDTYAAVDIAAEMANEVIMINNVIFAEATPGRATSSDKASNFTGESDGVTLNFRTNFIPTESVEAGTYNVKAVVNYYVPKTGTPSVQLYPIEYFAIHEASVPVVTIDGEPVEDIDTPVEVEEGKSATITFTPAEGEEIYWRFAASAEAGDINAYAAEEGFELYTAPITVDKSGSLEYYSVKGASQSAINTIEFSMTTGIAGVEADSEADAEYFDLMGRSVANPVNGGLYIERRGDKVRKVIVK